MKPSKVQVVVFRRHPVDLEPQILILEKAAPTGTTWHLVTGFIESGEEAVETALREVEEETGIESLGEPIDLEHEITFVSRFTHKPELEKAFAIESLNLSEKVDISDNPDQEHTGYRWVDAEEAHLLLQWDSFKDSIHSLLQLLQD